MGQGMNSFSDLGVVMYRCNEPVTFMLVLFALIPESGIVRNAFTSPRQRLSPLDSDSSPHVAT